SVEVNTNITEEVLIKTYIFGEYTIISEYDFLTLKTKGSNIIIYYYSDENTYLIVDSENDTVDLEVPIGFSIYLNLWDHEIINQRYHIYNVHKITSGQISRYLQKFHDIS